jgi:hypothetical protein
MKKSDDQTRTAYHEAGHAVLQIALGVGCAGVTIVPDLKAGSAGAASHGGEYGKIAEDFGQEDDDVATLRLIAEDAFHLRHAITCYAGAEAVRRWKPRRKDWRAGASNDYSVAIDRVNEITADEESCDLLFKYAMRRCAVLVEHYWPEITVVAQLLLKRKSITGEEARKVWVKSLRARRGGLMNW